jgi:phosphoribosyl 1,2-cyclic phosphodiesterase
MNIDVLASSSAGNAYIISDGNSRILLECGIPFKEMQKRSKFTLSKCVACVVSHSHGDHSKAWKDVAWYMPVYMLKETAAELGALPYQYKPVDFLNTFTVGTFDILPIPAKHDVPCAAYIIQSQVTGEKLLFATDYMYLEHSVQQANYALIEVNYQQKYIDEAVNNGSIDIVARRRIMRSHAELQTAIKILQGLDNTKLKAVYIAHMSDRNCNADEVKEEIQKAIGKPVYICKK